MAAALNGRSSRSARHREQQPRRAASSQQVTPGDQLPDRLEEDLLKLAAMIEEEDNTDEEDNTE